MLTLTLLAATLAFGGDTTHEVELRGGIHHLSRADRMLSAKTHAGASPTVELSWSPRGPRMAHVVETSFTPAQPGSGPSWTFTTDGEQYETGKDAAPMLDLRYAVGRRVDAGPWTLHVGGTVTTHFENVTTHYGFMGMDSYLGVFELAPWVDVRRNLGKRHSVELQGWVPLAAWVSRNPYATHSGQHIYNTRDTNPIITAARYVGDGSLQTLDSYQAVHLRVGYAYQLNDTFALVARGRADGLHLSEPHPLVQWQFGMNLGVRGSF